MSHIVLCMCAESFLCIRSLPSGNSVSLVSTVMAISSGAGEREGRRGGIEGEAERGSWGREAEGGRFSSSPLLFFRWSSSVFLLLLWYSVACWALRGRLEDFELFSLVGSFWKSNDANVKPRLFDIVCWFGWFSLIEPQHFLCLDHKDAFCVSTSSHISRNEVKISWIQTLPWRWAVNSSDCGHSIKLSIKVFHRHVFRLFSLAHVHRNTLIACVSLFCYFLYWHLKSIVLNFALQILHVSVHLHWTVQLCT